MSTKLGVVSTPDVDHYTYRVSWSVGDGEYVATCLEFPSLSWLDVSRAEAVEGLVNLVRGVVSDMSTAGEPVPVPLSERTYSGRFNLRVSQELHRRLATHAAEANLSLNSYIGQQLAQWG